MTFYESIFLRQFSMKLLGLPTTKHFYHHTVIHIFIYITLKYCNSIPFYKNYYFPVCAVYFIKKLHSFIHSIMKVFFWKIGNPQTSKWLKEAQTWCNFTIFQKQSVCIRYTFFVILKCWNTYCQPPGFIIWTLWSISMESEVKVL